METVTRTALAIEGGKPAVDGPLPAFSTIGAEERLAVELALAKPLSGFLGGELIGGHYVQALEEEWAATFGVKHAVSFNSATSALLGACVAVGVGRESIVLTTPYTMSATVAVPAFLGATIHFGDIEHDTFCLHSDRMDQFDPSAIIATNLFGHPAELQRWREYAASMPNCVLIEDNSQSPFAKEYGRYAGTVGDIGVFSLNVHKHIQCGEGGIAVTNDDDFGNRLRHFRNHGELAGGLLGLNLRLTEVCAAIALTQLRKAPEIMAGRKALAEEIIDMAQVMPFVRSPVVREGCEHVYYCVPFLVSSRLSRNWLCDALTAEGVPMRKGYVKPLYNLPAFEKFVAACPMTELVESQMMLFEVCAHDPSSKQLEQFREAFLKVGDALCR